MASDRRMKLAAHINDELTSLQIANTTPADAGTYKMVATNPLGQVESECKVTVHSESPVPLNSVMNF